MSLIVSETLPIMVKKNKSLKKQKKMTDGSSLLGKQSDEDQAPENDTISSCPNQSQPTESKKSHAPTFDSIEPPLDRKSVV